MFLGIVILFQPYVPNFHGKNIPFRNVLAETETNQQQNRKKNSSGEFLFRKKEMGILVTNMGLKDECCPRQKRMHNIYANQKIGPSFSGFFSCTILSDNAVECKKLLICARLTHHVMGIRQRYEMYNAHNITHCTKSQN